MDGSIYDRIESICAERGTKVGTLEKVLNFGNGTIKKWKDSAPRIDKLIEIADYFGVSVEYLARGFSEEDEKKPATADGDGLSESDMELVDMVMRIPPEKREALRTVLQALSEDGEVFPSGDH